MRIIVTLFNTTKEVEVVLHNMEESDTYDEILWVERVEDWYALLSYQLKDKKVAVITKSNWMKGDEV